MDRGSHTRLYSQNGGEFLFLSALAAAASRVRAGDISPDLSPGGQTEQGRRSTYAIVAH